MRSLVNHWSPLTHASHCMTTSRPAAATQTRARVSPAMQPNEFFMPIRFLPQPSLFLGLATSLEHADLHTLRIGYTFQVSALNVLSPTTNGRTAIIC